MAHHAAGTRSDGGNWSVDLGLVQPDAADPPELQVCAYSIDWRWFARDSVPPLTPSLAQFYRIRPFYVGNTSRLAAHVLNYAPSPSQDILGMAWGHQPSGCSAANDSKWKPNGYNPRCENGGCCHGP